MHTRVRLRCALFGLIPLFWAACVHAQLIDRGNGLIYDSAQNITWINDGNLPLTSGYAASHGFGCSDCEGSGPADGSMGWSAAVAWAAELTYGGFNDWRLPKITKTTIVDTVGDGAGGVIHLDSSDAGEIPVEDEISVAYAEFEAAGRSGPAIGANGGGLVHGWWLETRLMQPFRGQLIEIQDGGAGPYFAEGWTGTARAVRDGDVVAPVPITAPFFLLASAATVITGFRQRRPG